MCEKAIPKFILKMSTETCQQILKNYSSYIKVIHSQCRKLDNRDAFCMFHVTISILQCKQVLVCSHLQVQQERHNSAYRDHKQESGATTLHKLLVICTFGAFHKRLDLISCSPQRLLPITQSFFTKRYFQSALDPITRQFQHTSEEQ